MTMLRFKLHVGKVSYKDFSDTLVNLSSGIDRQEAQKLASLLDRRKVGGIEYKNILKSLREIQSKEMIIVPTTTGSNGSGSSNNRNQQSQRRRGDDYDDDDDRSINDRYSYHHDDDRRRDHRDINNYNRREYEHIDDRMESNGNYHRRDDNVEYKGGSYSDNYNRKDNDTIIMYNNDNNINNNNNYVLDNHQQLQQYNNYSSFYSDSKRDGDRPVRHTNKDTSRISTNSIGSRSSPQRSASPSLLPSSPGRRRQYAHNATTITPSVADIYSSDVEASTLNYFTTSDVIHEDSHVLDPHYKPPHIQASLITVPTRHMNNPDINRTPLFTDYYHSIYRYPYHIDKTTDEVKRERGGGRSSSAPTRNNHSSLDSFLQNISDGNRIQRRPYKYSLKAKLLQQTSVDDDNDDNGVHRDGDTDSRVTTPTTTSSATANATATAINSRRSPTHRRVRRSNPISDPFQTSADNTILDLNPLYKIHAKRNVDNHSSFHHRIDPQILGK